MTPRTPMRAAARSYYRGALRPDGSQPKIGGLADRFQHGPHLVQGKHVEHWINGAKVVQFERESPELQKLIAASKFKHLDKFGTFAKGHIALQDHNSEVWFRNIKIRELNGQYS